MANPHPIREQAFFLRQKPRSWMESSSGIHSLLLKRWAVTSVLACPLGLLLSGVQPGVAQLIPDGSTGTQIQSGASVEGLPADLIEGGTVRDSNLFHSFQEFNVESDRGVYFNPQTGILTILTRVTGGNVSNIDGTLGVLGSADLFLLNPSGIVFGPDAQLDISGSFVGSTAESIFFENYEFSAADTDTPPLLTLSVPLGLRMGSNPGSLNVNQATLSVDQALTLAADSLDISGDLQAGGDITLRGQERRLGEGAFTTGGYLFTQDLDGTNVDFLIPHENVIRADGDVQLSDDYTGPSLYVLAGGQVTVGDGTGSVEITDSTGASVTATIADGVGGTQAVTVNATGEPKLDIRAGVDWSQLPGGAPGNENLSNAQVVFGNETGTSGATSASILAGEIVNTGGRVALSNLFSPNQALVGAIQVEVIDTSTSIDAVSSPQTGPVVGTDGGDIVISGRGDVVTGELISRSDIVLADEDGNASDRDVIGGNGGDIAITTLGDVTASFIAALSFTTNDSGMSTAGDGGDITLSSINGDITVTDTLGSPSYLLVTEGDVTGGDGGDITIATNTGDITTAFVETAAIANTEVGDAVGGQSGNLSLRTTSGDITMSSPNADTEPRVSASAVTQSTEGDVTGGTGGEVAIATDTGNITTTFLESVAITETDIGDAVGGQGGNLSFSTTSGDITMNSTFSTNLVASYSNTKTNLGNVQGGDGGNISVTTVSGNFRTVEVSPQSEPLVLTASSFALLEDDGKTEELIGGNGGDIVVSTVSGDVDTAFLASYSFSYASSDLFSGNITGSNAGNIAITTVSGNVTAESIDAISLSGPSDGNVRGGNGGNITVSTTTGDIALRQSDLDSFAFAPTGLAGNGGDIRITTEQGNLIGIGAEIGIRDNFPSLRTFAVSQSSSGSGSGGNVTLAAQNQIANLNIFTPASEAEAGTVEINGSGDLVLDNVNTVTSVVIELDVPFEDVVTFEEGSIGQSGDVTITGNSDLTFMDSRIESTTQGPNPAGDVRVESPGLITFQGNSQFSSNTNSTGNAGAIQIESDTGIVLTGPEVSLAAISNGDGSAGSISLDAPDIRVDEGAEISTVASDDGRAGDIRLDTETLTVTNGSKILAASSGAGDGGEIVVDASTAVNLGEGVQDFAPIISVETSGAGRAGDITINTPTFTLSETARITATATETATNTEVGGSITLNASDMDLAGVVGIFAETEGQAPAGTLTLQPFDANFDQGVPQFDPELNVTLAPRAEISASTSGTGQGGGLQIFAPEAITIAGPGRLAVETRGAGDGGDIEIRTRQLTLTDGVEISASSVPEVVPIIETTIVETVELVDAPPDLLEVGDAGQTLDTVQVVSGQPGTPLTSISGSLSEDGDVDLYQIYLSGDGTFSASTVDLTRLDTQLFLFSAPDGLGIYGNDDDANCAGCRESTLPAQNLLTPTETGIYYLAVSEFANNPLAESGEEIFPNSFDDDVDFDAIKAPTGPGEALPLADWTGGVVDAGDYVISLTGVESGPIEITTITEVEEIIGFLEPNFDLGDAGDINIFADTFNLTNGATLQTNTAGSGDAGTIALTIDDTLNLEQGNIAANTGDTASGRGGNIEVEAGRVRLNDSRLSVNSQGQGIGGDILVVADSLFLKQGSEIDAATASSDGGNITLTLEEVLLLSGQSEITATAGLEEGAGNGGDIDLQSKFVIAAPDGPNRIIANAFEGNGGNINIATTSLFGEEFLEIEASSQFGLQGTVTLDSPDIDPARSLTELPTTLVDASNLIADACPVDGRHGRSQFVATGRGGLPTQPTSYLISRSLLPDLGLLATTTPDSPTSNLQEAQSWNVAANGDIVLAANSADTLDSLLWDARQAYQQADYGTATTLWREAVKTLAQGSDPVAYASTLSNLALAHHHLGEWEQAQNKIATIQQVLTPELATTHPWLVAQIFNTQASLQFAQGHAQVALDTWQQAANAYVQAGNEGGELRVLLNQTQAWQSLGFYSRAEAQLESIATALADQPPSSVQALTLLHWGTALRARGETERSQQTLESALAITQTLNEPSMASAILLNLGHTAQAQGHAEQALAYYQNAAATAPTALTQFQAQVSQLDILATQDAVAAKTLGADLALTLQTNPLPTSREGIYAQLHLAATLLQTDATLASPDQIMNLLLTADQQAQQLNDTPAQTYILGYQAQVYRQMQQGAKAQALTERALHQAQVLEAPAMIYQWAEQLGQLRRDQGDRSGAIVAYTKAVNALSTLRGDLIASSEDAQFTFRDTVEPVYRELVKLLLQGEAGQPVEPVNLTQARLLIEDLQLAELQDYFQDACVQANPIVADEVDPTAAVIYPILLDDRLDVIVSVAGQPVHHHSTPIAAEQVEQTAYQLLETLTTALGSGQASTTQQLQQVYDWILDPVEAALEQQSIETLVFVADGVLRTLPFTALHDGDQYLVEQYNVVLSPGLNLLDPQPLQRQDLRMLAGGISESRPGFPPLPFVTDELQQITTQVSEHQVLFNQDLTQANLAESLATAPASVVHLATHGTFGTSAEETFILTWDGKLNIKDLGSLLQSRDRSSNIPIELLVFSACRTAAGDSRAVLGIAGMAIRSGVRSALAGLWPLDDRATAVFMEHFYEALAQPEVTKAEAFRQAQLALMQDSRFRTPYYWSPFVMMGNWL